MAAYIDSEGCISILSAKGKANFSLMLTISNCDVRLIEWCKNTFGVGTVCMVIRRSDKHRQCYNWRASANQAEEILKFCYPYFTIKKEQADIVFSFRRTFFSNGKLNHKNNPLGAGVMEQRRVMQVNLSQLKHGVVQ
jgi:hypothetical protein